MSFYLQCVEHREVSYRIRQVTRQLIVAHFDAIKAYLLAT
jgi:hypothetical protein